MGILGFLTRSKKWKTLKTFSSRLRLAECNGVYGRPRLMVDALCDDIGPELVTNFQVGTSKDELTQLRWRNLDQLSESRRNWLLPTSLLACSHHNLSQVG